MYLPHEIRAAQVLITVKTYPQPSSKYEELVCTAGFLPNGKWVRIYPIPFRVLPYEQQYAKYHWITLDVMRNLSDFRPESYRPMQGLDRIAIGNKLDTGKNRDWLERKKYVLNEVFTSVTELVKLAKGEEKKSLAVLKPREIIDFVIEPDEREWKRKWLDQLRQFNLFDLDEHGQGKPRKVIPKLPYKYYYKFLSQGDKAPRKLMIEDWELGALFWRCLYKYGQDERKANQLVRDKYFGEFLMKDLYLFLGTTLQYHLRAPQPFIIIGLFTPPRPQIKSAEQSSLTTIDGLQQQKLFDIEAYSPLAPYRTEGLQ